MLQLHRLDVIQCKTALEVELLAALIRERRVHRELMRAAKKPASFTFVVDAPSDPDIIARQANVTQIQEAVGQHFDVTANDIRSQRRQVYLCKARHVAVILCHILTLHSYPQMGRLFGDRDHTTIMSAVRKMQWLKLELTHELHLDDSLALWTKTAFDKTVNVGRNPTKTLPDPQPAVA